MSDTLLKTPTLVKATPSFTMQCGVCGQFSFKVAVRKAETSALGAQVHAFTCNTDKCGNIVYVDSKGRFEKPGKFKDRRTQ